MSYLPSTAASRPWEGWDDQPDGPSWGLHGEDYDYTAVSQDEAGAQLFELLARLKIMSVLSAKQACLVAFWASKAGAIGRVSELAVKPDAQAGKFSARFDKVVGTKISSEGTYSLGLARRLRHDATRRWDQIPIKLPLEVLGQELASSSGPKDALRQALVAGEVPRLFLDHPAVRSCSTGGTIFPVSLYIDAVAYSRLDSALGVWAYFTYGGQ